MPGPIVFYELATSAPVDYSIDTKSVTKKYICPPSTYDENAIALAFTSYIPRYYDTLPLQGIKLDPIGGSVWMCDATYALSPFVLLPGVTGSLGPEFEFDITAGMVHITQSLATRYRWRPQDMIQNGSGVFAAGQNLTVDTTTPGVKPVSPDLWTVSDDDIGNILLVSGVQSTGTGTWVLGSWWEITNVVGGFWVLGTGSAPNPGTPGATGAMWSMVSSLKSGFGDGAGSEAGTAANYQQAIGVQTDSVAGTDIPAPKFEFSIAAQVAPLTFGFLNTIYRTVGKACNSPWKGGDVGETIYLGATGQCSPGGVWQVRHKFARGQNLYAVPVSVRPASDAFGNAGDPAIVIPYKGGWEYLWTAYSLTADVARGFLLSVPAAAYVEQVSRSADFTVLGLGS